MDHTRKQMQSWALPPQRERRHCSVFSDVCEPWYRDSVVVVAKEERMSVLREVVLCGGKLCRGYVLDR